MTEDAETHFRMCKHLLAGARHQMMKFKTIELPDFEAAWVRSPPWAGFLFGTYRRWVPRWTVDHLGCRCVFYWEYK